MKDKLDNLETEHEAMKTEMKVQQLKQEVDQSDETSPQPDFSDRVRSILGKRAANKLNKDNQCLKCQKRFDLPW